MTELVNEFVREPRYIVFKLKDIEKYLSSCDLSILMNMGREIHAGRLADGKAPFNAVVVEQDWPEFEPTWAAIEARMSHEVDSKQLPST
jgi:hypothetical protein